jgi:hypothetical protein
MGPWSSLTAAGCFFCLVTYCTTLGTNGFPILQRQTWLRLRRPALAILPISILLLFRPGLDRLLVRQLLHPVGHTITS